MTAWNNRGQPALRGLVVGSAAQRKVASKFVKAPFNERDGAVDVASADRPQAVPVATAQ
jgi:hypothetical protein